VDAADQIAPRRPRADQRPSLLRLIRQFLGGTAYLLLASAIVAALSAQIFSTFAAGIPDWWPLFGRTFVAMSAGTLVILLVLLTWLVHWATGRERRRRQFGLVSVFLTTALLAAYLALVRWLVVGVWPAEPPLWGFAALGSIALFLLIAGFFPLLCWLNSLIWLAARLVRTPLAQRWLLGRHRP
jgi:MFS family permease